MNFLAMTNLISAQILVFNLFIQFGENLPVFKKVDSLEKNTLKSLLI